MIRIFDFVLSTLSIFVLSPLFVIVMVILRFTGEKEIFFIQERIGKGGEILRLVKFSTMVKDSPNIGTGTVTLKDDPRVLPVGRILRSSKINELPQLINVLRGSLSIIGPRPQTRRCFDAFPESVQNKIINVRPGLSGIGSIVFRREEEMMEDSDEPEIFYDEIIMPYKGLLEEWFVENISLLNYFKCIFMTVVKICRPESELVWVLFPNLPPPPEELRRHTNYSAPYE